MNAMIQNHPSPLVEPAAHSFALPSGPGVRLQLHKDSAARKGVSSPRCLLLLTTLTTFAALTGCATGTSSNATKDPVSQTHLTGSVFGGQQPISGSTIQLYTVGTTGAGSNSAALITTTVVSNAGGQFNITGDYQCSSATQVYITATGGNAGSGNNTAITLMAALGSCSTLQANAATIFININELTTVAAVYALAPFMTGTTHIGAQGTNPVGLVNAFTTATALVATTSGTVAAAPAGVTLPIARLDTLANILAACVNTTGAASTQCTTLFNATGAVETAGAALAIAKSPGAPGITALWSLTPSQAPFQPALTAQPNDFTLAINYAGPELLSPNSLAIDSSGNTWVTNEAGASAVKLPHPTPAFTTATYTGGNTLLAPRGVSIDRSNNVWIANTGANNVVELSTTGAVLSGTGFTGGGLATPVAIANDSAGNAWIANLAGNSITQLTPGGTPTSASPFNGGNALATPTGVAIDSTGRILTANAGSGSLCIFTPNAAALQGCASDGTLFGSTAVAVSGSTTAMAGTTTGSAVAGAFTLASNTGAVNGASPVAGGGLTLPSAVAFDGSGTAWFTNTQSLSAFASSTPVTPPTGYNGLNNPAALAIDPSGNIWTANAGDNSISIFVGLATPVQTPLAITAGP